MVTLRSVALLACFSFMLSLVGCGDAANGTGSGGRAGTGGMAGGPDAGVSCVESGCQDNNDCTIDGACERISGQCIGADFEPVNTPCDEIFVCDGEGSCVGCNVDAQCNEFFPDNDCREAPQCLNHGCPLPEALPDGTPCMGGECRLGECSGPWGPKQQLVPMACGSSSSAGLFDASMDLTVAPTTITAAAPFSAFLDVAIVIPQSFLQDMVIAGFPAFVPSLEVSDARAEITSTRVASGTPVNTILAPRPQTFAIPQRATVGSPGGQVCDTNDDCPLGKFGQNCVATGRCGCACQPSCVPQTCANTVTGDVVLVLETIQGATYRAFPTGEVCFNAGGSAPDPEFALQIRTGVRVTSNPGPLAVECEGGTVNDNGTPEIAEDDFIDPNPPEAQVCFPIGAPELSSN